MVKVSEGGGDEFVYGVSLEFVIFGADAAAGFVEYDCFKFFWEDAFAVYFYEVVNADFHGEVCACVAVDLDESIEDELVTFTA